MSNNNAPLVAGIVALLLGALAAATPVHVFPAHGAELAPLIGLVGPTVATLAVLGKVNNIDQRTEDLTNGLMDAKLRAGVADVLPDHLIDPGAKDQLEADRARRDEAGHGNGNGATSAAEATA